MARKEDGQKGEESRWTGRKTDRRARKVDRVEDEQKGQEGRRTERCTEGQGK